MLLPVLLKSSDYDEGTLFADDTKMVYSPYDQQFTFRNEAVVTLVGICIAVRR